MKSKTFSSVITGGALATIMVLFGSVAPAHAALGNADAPQHRRSVKLQLPVAAEVGQTQLPAGDYDVRVTDRDGGATVEFSRWTFNPYAQEGLPVWTREVVATMAAQPHAMNAAAARTGLTFASTQNDQAVALQIGGEDIEYGF